MRRFWLGIALLLSLGVNAGVLATIGIQHLRGAQPAAPVEPPAGGGPGPSFQNLANRLRLEGEPRERFIAVQRRFFDTARTERQRLGRLRQELRAELVAGRSDRARAEAISRDLAETTGRLEQALVANILDSKEILTPDQQRQFLRLVAARMAQQIRMQRPAPRPFLRRPWRGEGEAAPPRP